MERQRFESLMRYRPFRTWWSRELKGRPCKLIDLATRKDMAHEKRIFLEKPRIDDLLKFLSACEVPDINIQLKESKYNCELLDVGTDLRIVEPGHTATHAVERATLEFLKVKTT